MGIDNLNVEPYVCRALALVRPRVMKELVLSRVKMTRTVESATSAVPSGVVVNLARKLSCKLRRNPEFQSYYMIKYTYA